MRRSAVILLALALPAGLAAGIAAARAEPGAAADRPAGSHYVLGKPYQFDGVWYRPGFDYDYDVTGLAVVYDADFSGQRTTDGEIYDDRIASGAHKTLPLPSLVLVTDLDNGRRVAVRVNDRGPFVDNQVIELSGRAAAALGIPRRGQAHVRVQILAPESRALAAAYGADGAAPSLAAPAPRMTVEPLAVEPLAAEPLAAEPLAAKTLPAKPVTAKPVTARPAPSPVRTPPAGPAKATPMPTPAREAAAAEPPPPPSPKPASGAAAAPPGPRATETAALPSSAPPPAGGPPLHPDADPLIAHADGYFVQTGAFTDPAAAERLRSRLAALGQARVVTVPAGALSFSAVMLGPIASLAEARRKLGQVAALGYKDAVLIAQ